MPNFSGIWTVTQQMQAKGASTWPATPGAPTIGTATAGNAQASVTFTAPACAGFPATITGYQAISTPGCFTATGASSPLVVTGLSNGTAYTLQVRATNTTGYGPLSAASNSVTPVVPVTSQSFTTPGTFSWVAPSGITSVAAVAVGGGQGGGRGAGCYIAGYGGMGGSLAYKNNYSVTPGNSYTVVVGAGGLGTSCITGANGADSYFCALDVLRASGGKPGGGTNVGTASFFGGNGGTTCCQNNGAGGGGAGGYSGAAGGFGGSLQNVGDAPASGGGGGGGGGSGANSASGGGAGGGVGLLGQGSSGAGGARSTGGGGGSSGATGSTQSSGTGGAGGAYGGGGGGGVSSPPNTSRPGGVGRGGAVRIVWCCSGARGTPSFPSTNVGP